MDDKDPGSLVGVVFGDPSAGVPEAESGNSNKPKKPRQPGVTAMRHGRGTICVLLSAASQSGSSLTAMPP
ncbi:hypothetical protein [Streptomyces sp. NPDC059894]|uniref:hypothetical protein n=1 Tax=unclassified Streptomyces TaxID=2593676 RepID=UPI003667DD4A